MSFFKFFLLRTHKSDNYTLHLIYLDDDREVRWQVPLFRQGFHQERQLYPQPVDRDPSPDPEEGRQHVHQRLPVHHDVSPSLQQLTRISASSAAPAACIATQQWLPLLVLRLDMGTDIVLLALIDSTYKQYLLHSFYYFYYYYHRATTTSVLLLLLIVMVF